MDAEARAELQVLRRRAYGPDADIRDDPAALARLIELEDLVLPRVSADSHAAQSPHDMVADGDEQWPVSMVAALPAAPLSAPAYAVDTARNTSPHRPAPRRSTIVASVLAAVTIIVALVLVQPLADPIPRSAPAGDGTSLPQFVAEARSKTLMTIRHDEPFGGYIQLPTDQEIPPFPATTELGWAAFLGDYYGWELWIAGSAGGTADEHCILIRDDDETRAQCADAEEQQRGRLRVSIDGADIPAADLPDPMGPRDRIRFRWIESGSIQIAIGMFGGD